MLLDFQISRDAGVEDLYCGVCREEIDTGFISLLGGGVCFNCALDVHMSVATFSACAALDAHRAAKRTTGNIP